MKRTDAEWVDWTRAQRVSYELAPLVETRGERVQTGFELTLHAAAPMQEPAGSERHAAAGALSEELMALMQAAVPESERQVRVEVDQPHTAVLRPENEFKPELAVRWRVFHASHDTAVSADDRERMAAVEKRLQALGLKRGRW